MSRRERVEHTEEWEEIEPRLRWDEQREYELLRPSVIFGDSPAERAGQTGAAERNTSLAPLYGWSRRGQRAYLKVPR
jgi:hypothetical protein